MEKVTRPVLTADSRVIYTTTSMTYWRRCLNHHLFPIARQPIENQGVRTTCADGKCRAPLLLLYSCVDQREVVTPPIRPWHLPRRLKHWLPIFGKRRL